MQIIETALSEVFILEPTVFSDARGFFFEHFNVRDFANTTGFNGTFVQDNHSKSIGNVLRGLHYQVRQPQGKLVRVIAGEVLDVVVDIRKSSPTFGRWISTVLSADNKRAHWIPAGFAHGFLVRSETAELSYKTTDYWAPEMERCILWNDPQLNIDWQFSGTPILSDKDRAGTQLANAEIFP